MINVLKKYWLLILIILIVVNVLGFYLILESIRISDSLEHIESDEFAASLERKDFFYTLLVKIVFILDCCLLLFVPYLMIRKIVKKSNLNKK